jgi:hypothetical protein
MVYKLHLIKLFLAHFQANLEKYKAKKVARNPNRLLNKIHWIFSSRKLSTQNLPCMLFFFGGKALLCGNFTGLLFYGNFYGHLLLKILGINAKFKCSYICFHFF